MMPRQSSRILLILTSLTLLVSIVGNIATGSLPDWVKEWAWWKESGEMSSKLSADLLPGS